MWVILAIVILVALIISLLCIPLELILFLDTGKTPKTSIRLIWMFGIVDRAIAIPVWEKAISIITGRNIHNVITTTYKIFKIEGFFRQVQQLCEGMLRSTKIKNLKADVKIAIPNPFYAGIAFAIAAPINLLLKLLHYEINVWPSFTTGYIVDGQAQIDIKTRPIMFISLLARFTFSKPVIKSFRILAAAKWKQKK